MAIRLKKRLIALKGDLLVPTQLYLIQNKVHKDHRRSSL